MNQQRHKTYDRKNAAQYYIYWNVHKNCFSLKYRGRVIKHFLYGYLESARFQVSEPGRQRVINEKRKNVHAYIVADERPLVFKKRPGIWSQLDNADKISITYNPYKYDSFVIRETEAPIDTARRLCLDDRKLFIRE